MKKLMGGGKRNAAESLKEKLEAKGFEVTLYESPMDKIQSASPRAKSGFQHHFAGKDTIADFVGAQDLIITLVDVAGGFQAVARPGFGMTKGGGEIPGMFELQHRHRLPAADDPGGHSQARTYINTYDSAPLRWMCWWTS